MPTKLTIAAVLASLAMMGCGCVETAQSSQVNDKYTVVWYDYNFGRVLKISAGDGVSCYVFKDDAAGGISCLRDEPVTK